MRGISASELTADLKAINRADAQVALARAERGGVGCDYGAPSFTTKSQADQLARSLRLGPKTRLLDIGSGSGWPGVYLGRSTGSQVVLIDFPLRDLYTARRRLQTEGVKGGAIAASGAALPLQDSSFDAATSSDLLCCLAAKLSVLRACHRVLKPGGVFSFLVIARINELVDEETRSALEIGRYPAHPDDRYPTLLEHASFDIENITDVTDEYEATLEAWIGQWEESEAELVQQIGDEEFQNRQSRRVRTLRAARDGRMSRHLITAQAR